MLRSEFKNIKGKDYITIYNELELFCIKETNPLLIGEFGDASFPSVSDLDVFICLNDNNFAKQRKRIINYIYSDNIRQYVFFHDPLILPESLLPYFKAFHTAYNLKLSYQIGNISFPEINQEQLDFLNTIWTTFLMGIGPNFILNTSQSKFRDKLLVFKNICQSISNLDKNKDALLFSEEIRKSVFDNKLKFLDFCVIFEEKFKELFRKTNELPLNYTNYTIRKDRFRIEKNKSIIVAAQNDFEISKGEIILKLNPSFFNFFSQFYYNKSEDSTIQKYINNSIIIRKICKKMNFEYPFIVPFGYQYYRSDLKFKIKKIIYST